ncbi:MAG: STAS domain-containing protein [Spirochaetia bacterium]|nr:STAS domain-containing protein [Spirochaetia bacterium]
MEPLRLADDTLVSIAGDGMRIRLSGNLDLLRAARLKDGVQTHLKRGVPIFLDLQDCQWIDSAGFAALMRLSEATGEKIKVSWAPSQVRAAVTHLGLESWISLED